MDRHFRQSTIDPDTVVNNKYFYKIFKENKQKSGVVVEQ